ncbi:hypothetical protein GIB67_020865 [Kingdonia uniflora]|uniref:CRAL-TRIO domain-containing protein n=1 Tax=Kingdonia uniflora TaxID=39325 RepID=A0A7J7M7G0_9MAGN|nr:hypothetical protein GIB67_020865 [Kingdonia uniflora]
MEKNQEMTPTQLRKSIEKLGLSAHKYDDSTLMRFLIARSMDVEKAAKMFVQEQKWREEFVPMGFIPDCQVGDELGAKKIYLQSLSRDGEHPVMIIKTNRHFSASDQLQFKRFVVHLLDKVIASSFKEGKEIGNEKIVGILDLDKISYKNVDPRALITGFQFLQTYYPERLAKLFIVSMPWFFVSVWKMVSHFLEKATLEKIVIVSNEEGQINFIKYIGEDTLPEEYGGRAKLVALQNVKLEHFPPTLPN